MNKPIGWIFLDKNDEKFRTGGGGYTTPTTKLYQSEGRALAAKKNSMPAQKAEVSVVPVYLAPERDPIEDILDLPLKPDNDSGEANIRDYLNLLLFKVLDEQEGFNGKRPFGNSGWIYDLYFPLIKYGYIEGELLEEDGEETIYHVNEEQALEVFNIVLAYLFRNP